MMNSRRNTNDQGLNSEILVSQARNRLHEARPKIAFNGRGHISDFFFFVGENFHLKICYMSSGNIWRNLKARDVSQRPQKTSTAFHAVCILSLNHTYLFHYFLSFFVFLFFLQTSSDKTLTLVTAQPVIAKERKIIECCQNAMHRLIQIW